MCREPDKESIEQRETRLGKRRERDRAHRAAIQSHHRDVLRLKLQRKRTLETSEQRKACLERQRLTDEQRRTVGSKENRQTCLERQRFTNEQSKNTESKEH